MPRTKTTTQAPTLSAYKQSNGRWIFQKRKTYKNLKQVRAHMKLNKENFGVSVIDLTVKTQRGTFKTKRAALAYAKTNYKEI